MRFIESSTLVFAVLAMIVISIRMAIYENAIFQQSLKRRNPTRIVDGDDALNAPNTPEYAPKST
ncbi:hypothetical protein FHW17_004067 [Phyllobacterium sp. P30BS-XVII]|nr:hypothetical protein [Phyllobacterium sp. P30BS-XVII]